MNTQNSTITKLAETALMAALCYVSFTFLQIKIPVPGGDATSIHIGNAFCVLAALLIGGVYGGLSGAIGMGIADLMDPVYITGAPKTFVLKFCIGLITGLVAHKIAKINESTDKKYVFKWSVIASIAGLAFNVIADPIVGYFYKQYILGQPQELAQALAKMASEDKTLRVVNDSANRQTLLYGMGDQHLDIIVSKLKERYKVDIELSKPKVAFRETIRKNSDVEGKHKKQSGGHGQYGHVKMRFEPSGDLETPYVFEQVVVGGAVPKNYFPAVEKGLQECVQKGPLAAYPVVGVKATLYDGSYHPVDSSEMAFKMATILAFKKGFMDASPVLLEPIVSMKVIVPDKYTGDVMGDLNKRRGRVLGMNPDHAGNTIIEADVPQLEIYGYSTTLRSMTGGSGDFSYEFARYEQAPNDIQAKEIEARASKLDTTE